MRLRGLCAEGAAAEEEAEHPQKCTGDKLIRPFVSKSDANPHHSKWPLGAQRFVGYTL